MFEGYYGRRRLKTLLISTVCSLILFVLLYRHQDVPLSVKLLQRLRSSQINIRKQFPDEIQVPSDVIPDSKIRQPLPELEQKKFKDLLSFIEFLHSPFLDLPIESSLIIPILVLSKASNIEIRDAIRRTWGFDYLYSNDTALYKVFFLVGVDDFMIKRVRAEQILFDDVIQVSLPDVYSFLAYKELSALIWVRTYLPNAPFYIKTEDEVIMNIKAVVNNLLPTIESYTTQTFVLGWFGKEQSLDRGSYQKFVNALMSPSSTDLYYASNILYIVTSKAADRMLDAISHVEDIQHPGDPFVTGILREAAHVQIQALKVSTEDFKYELGNGDCRKKFEINPKLLLCTTSAARLGTSHSITEYFDVWNVFLSQNQTTQTTIKTKNIF